MSQPRQAKPSEEWGVVPGLDLTQQAVYVSGYLAECGVQKLWTNAAGSTRELRARVTDLPGELARIGVDCEVRGGDVEVRVAGRGTERVLEWRRQS